jgi:hypothetical protein
MNLKKHIENQKTWSQKTFGPGMRTEGIIKHISKEFEEIRKKPQDLLEWTDVIILALDGAWRAGYSAKEIITALEYKQRINFNRSWPPPGPETEPNEHLK